MGWGSATRKKSVKALYLKKVMVILGEITHYINLIHLVGSRMIQMGKNLVWRRENVVS